MYQGISFFSRALSKLFFSPRKSAIYSAGLSKTPLDSAGCSPYLVFRELSRAVFRFSRVAVGLFVHIASSTEHDFSSKTFENPLFLARLLTALFLTLQKKPIGCSKNNSIARSTGCAQSPLQIIADYILVYLCCKSPILQIPAMSYERLLTLMEEDSTFSC